MSVISVKAPLEAVRTLNEYKEIQALLSRFKRTGEKYSQGVCYCTNLAEGMREALFANLVQDDKEKCAVVICAEEKTAYAVKDALCSYGLASEVFPVRDYNFHNISATSHEWEYERLRILREIDAGHIDVVVTVPEGSLGILPPKEKISGSTGGNLKIGTQVNLESVCELLVSYGYCRAEQVEGQGQFAVRGDILDVFITDYENPVRLEFFGDEIDAAGFFDVMSQRRIENVSEISVTPIREQMPDNDALLRIDETLDKLVSSAKRKKKKDTEEKLLREKSMLSTGNLSNLDKYLPLMYDSYTCLFDYARGSVIVCDYPRVRDRLKSYLWQLNEDLVALAKLFFFVWFT